MKIALVILLTLLTALLSPPAFASNRVLSLDGDGDYVEIAPNEKLNSINSQVTMEAWIKPTAFPNAWISIIYKGDKRTSDACENRSYALFLHNSGLIHLASAPSGQGQYLNSPSGLIALNRWYHVAGIIDAKSGVMSILINSVEVARRAFGKDIHLSTLPLRIGGSHEAEIPDHSPFAGQIDEVRVWNIARTAAEIVATMHTTLSGREPGLVGYWRFEEGDEKALDLTGKGHDGTFVGDARCVKSALPTKAESYQDYLASLQLELSVRRRKSEGFKGVLAITVRRAPTSTVWQIPSLPVRIEIRDEASRLLAVLKAREGEPVVWTAPEDVQGTVSILATQTDSLGRKLEAQFTCRAHNITPITPRVGNWETYDVTDGLGGSRVLSILQDRNGTLWFGLVFNGVSRYDGRTFRTFTTKDGLPDNNVWVVFEDSKGNLWFGTMNYFTQKGAGVCRYDGKTFQTFTMKDGLVDNTVVAIYEDNRGHLWFGTMNGISEFDGRTFRNYTTADGLPSAPVGTITQDKDGNLWFGHGIKSTYYLAGATRYDGKSFTHFTTKDGLVNNYVNAIIADAQGNLWFGTIGGVSKYDGKSFQNFTTAEGLVNNDVEAVLQTKSGNLWFATFGGVSRYYDGKFQNFTTKDGLAHNWVMDITEDREGNLWFGTWDGSVSRYDGSVKSIPVDIGCMNAQRMDKRGNLWFKILGTGLGRYDGRNLQTYALEDGLLDTNIQPIYEDSRGNIWIGTQAGGLVRYDGEKFQTFTIKDGLPNNSAWAIWEDRKGILWVGTQGGGVCTYDGKRFVKVADEQELGSGWGWITDIIEDRKGNMWFAMPGHGVCRYDGEKFTRFTTENGLPYNTNWLLLEDYSGNIWIGTQDSGACRYDGQNFRTFTTKDGLTGDCVDGIFKDSRGNLWMSVGAGGVHKFDGRNFQVFTTDDGLLSNSPFGILEDEAGNLIFATSSGFTIHPSQGKNRPANFGNGSSCRQGLSCRSFRRFETFGRFQNPLDDTAHQLCISRSQL